MDGNIFDPQYVFAQDIAAVHKVVNGMNLSALGAYNRAYAQVKRSWDNQRVKFPVPQPGKLAGMVVDTKDYKITITYGPDLVCEARPAPWDIPAPEPPKNKTVVGVELMLGVYASQEDGAVTTVPVGTIINHGGKKLRLVELGKPGQLTYRLLWLETGVEI